MTTVLMVQLSNHSWHLISKKGHILKKDLSFHRLRDAEAYVKAYISSFQNWNYEMVPL